MSRCDSGVPVSHGSTRRRINSSRAMDQYQYQISFREAGWWCKRKMGTGPGRSVA